MPPAQQKEMRRSSWRRPITTRAANMRAGICLAAHYAAEALRLFGTRQMKAEVQAFEQCIIEWLNANPTFSLAGRCAWCGKAETPIARVLPFGAGEHREWLDTETGRGRPGIEGNGHSP